MSTEIEITYEWCGGFLFEIILYREIYITYINHFRKHFYNLTTSLDFNSVTGVMRISYITVLTIVLPNLKY